MPRTPPKKKVAEPAKQEPETRAPGPVEKLFARPRNPDGTVKEDSGICIMTEGASMMGDELRQSKGLSPRLSRNIFRPKGPTPS